MSNNGTIHIIYDGQCGFCIKSLKVIKALDVRGVLRFHDAHESRTFDEFPDLRGADVEDAMYAFVEGEAPQRGFFAFRRLLWSSPLMWPLIPFFYLPGIGFVGTRVYAWVARNRKNFGCESDFCPLTPAGPHAHARHKE